MTARKIFLTGATGFLGGELLRRLVQRDPRSVVCLVRAGSPREARQRGFDTLRTLLGHEEARRVVGRVTWLPGDVEAERLGLTEATFSALAREVEEIFHCAASTKFDLPYDEAHRVNVVGVERIVALAERAMACGGLRRLNHVSTAYSAGRVSGRVQADGLPEDDPHGFRNNYERTKAQAERYLRARMDRLPITISRPSIVVGDSQTGRTSNWNVVYYPMRLIASGRIPYVSRGGLELLDCVPVDYVVEGILALAAREDTRGGTYHLVAGDDAITVTDVLETTLAEARRRDPAFRGKTRALGPMAWGVVSMAARAFGGERARAALNGFSVYVDYTRICTRFDTTREDALLAECGVVRPTAREFWPRILGFAFDQNFGRTPTRERRTTSPLVAAIRSASAAVQTGLGEAVTSGVGGLASAG